MWFVGDISVSALIVVRRMFPFSQRKPHAEAQTYDCIISHGRTDCSDYDYYAWCGIGSLTESLTPKVSGLNLFSRILKNREYFPIISEEDVAMQL